MMPNMPPTGRPSEPTQGAPVPVGPNPGATGPGGGQDMEKQIVMLLSQARKMAEENGLDWNDIMAKVSGNKVRSDIPMPRPPSPGGP